MIDRCSISRFVLAPVIDEGLCSLALKQEVFQSCSKIREDRPETVRYKRSGPLLA
jgi:hypothetical protein